MEDGLSYRGLNVAGNPGPGPASINTELGVLLAGSEAKQLTKEAHCLHAVTPGGLQNNSTEEVSCPPEARVVLGVFPQAVDVGWVFQSDVATRERAGNSNVNSETLGVPPARDRHISRATTRSWTEQEPLLQHR